MGGSFFPPPPSGGSPGGSAGGDLTGTYPNPTIGTAKVTLAKMADLAQNLVIGRALSAGTGVPTALTQTQLTALLNAASGSAAGSLSIADFNKLASVPTGANLGLIGYSSVIDLTAVAASYQIVAPAGFRVRSVSIDFEVKSVTACTVGPTISVGSNASTYDDLVASAVITAFTTNTVETRIALTIRATNTGVVGAAIPDITANGIRVNVTNPATATALTARCLVFGALVPV